MGSSWAHLLAQAWWGDGLLRCQRAPGHTYCPLSQGESRGMSTNITLLFVTHIFPPGAHTPSVLGLAVYPQAWLWSLFLLCYLESTKVRRASVVFCCNFPSYALLKSAQQIHNFRFYSRYLTYLVQERHCPADDSQNSYYSGWFLKMASSPSPALPHPHFSCPLPKIHNEICAVCLPVPNPPPPNPHESHGTGRISVSSQHGRSEEVGDGTEQPKAALRWFFQLGTVTFHSMFIWKWPLSSNQQKWNASKE